MEKRTALAFVLAFMVLLAWTFIFGPEKKQKPDELAEPLDKQETTAPYPADIYTEKPAMPAIPEGIEQKGGQEFQPETEAKLIAVETPLYRAVFSNTGSFIRSFTLKEFHQSTDPHSPLIELVALNTKADFFEIDFSHLINSDKQKILYHVNEESLSLAPGSPPRDLIFSSMTSDGLSTIYLFRFYPDQYRIDLVVTLINTSDKLIEGGLETRLKNLAPEKKRGYYSFEGMALLLDDRLKEIKPKEMRREKVLSGRIHWMAYEDDYFITAIGPESPSQGNFKTHLLRSGIIESSYITKTMSLRPHEQVSPRFILYLGPRDPAVLKQLGNNLDLVINYGWTGIIAKPLIYLLRLFNKYVNNYGLSIILLTVLIKLLFWPLTHKSYQSMKRMQQLQPLMAKIREKHKNNKHQMNQELMGLYDTYKINPMAGILPMLIQIPVFFALFRLLGTCIELRHAPFMLWVSDLSAPERLLNFSFPIPFMSSPSGIPLLTLLMGLSMYIQQKMMPSPGSSAQVKVMMLLPFLFTVFFINFPSGLVLYWLVNNILSIGQQLRVLKKTE